MNANDKRVKQTLQKLLGFLIPAGMSPKEREALAKNAGISAETLRTSLKRQSMNADTLIRLLLARGVTTQTLENLPQTDLKSLPPGEAEWLELGRELSEMERKEFSGLIRYLRIKWSLR